MPLLKLQKFGGAIPVTGDRALPDGFAVESFNTWLYGDELRGVRPPLNIIAIQSGTRKVFRVPMRTSGGDPAFPGVVPPPSYLGDSVWIQFTDPDTDIVRTAMVNDSFERYYFCSPANGPTFNTYQRLKDGLSGYKLGVPAIAAEPVGYAPTITSIVGGGAPVVTRAYTYTWVNIYGEESAPAPPVTAAGNGNAVWNIGGIWDMARGEGLLGYAPQAKKYLYRTITSASGVATYFRVAEIAMGTLTYADDGAVNTDAKISGNLQLESAAWIPPPTNLQGLIAMPNGFLVGFVGNDVYMSEAYHFHAWPAEYKYTTEYPVVGLGVLGQTCVVCTQGFPATATGTRPVTMSFTKATTGEPCLSRGSIVSTPQGVIYASQNGLMMVGSGGIANITEKLITRDEWIKNYSPQYIRGVRYQNGYLALRALPTGQTRSGFFIDPSNLQVALTEFSNFDTIDNIHSDVWSGEVFIIDKAVIKRWDPPNDELMAVLWRSKEFQFPYNENFSAYSIYWDDARFAPNNVDTDIIAQNVPCRFRVWADRRLVYDQPVPRNGLGVRLPSGFKADIWQFEVRARAPVYSVHVASTMKELRGA